MQGILSSRVATLGLVLVVIGAGLLLTQYLGRRMGDARRSSRADVDRVLSDLALATGGRFEEGAKLTDHPLLGELRTYGATHIARGPFAIAVSVSYPGDDLRDDRTTLRIQRPANRAWREGTLPKAPGFEIKVAGDALEVVAAPEPGTVYIADVARLRALVDELARVAESLLS